MRFCRLTLWLPAYAACLAVATGTLAAEAEKLKFNRDIRPILSDNCFRCHGFDKNTREADLRLDISEGAFAERDGGVKPIVPGKPEESELIRRVTSTDEYERMPPVESHQSLTSKEIKTLKRWITEGAEYEPHWAFISPVEPPVPSVDHSKFRICNPIDAFIAARLASEGLAMSPEADKATLLRRVTLDLTGLPPTLEELDAFLADQSADAYEKAVDRLLASPRYGERMVLEWLDAARYADTNGYQGDLTRTMWPWRDWVIRAMNTNMPFDQFTVEQIAGDLLPSATVEQRLATGFNRNHPLNGEGGRIPEESRVDYVMDRVETTGTVWLGLTVGCCRCHDHKYDPLAQKEYYRLFAYFNNVAETGSVDGGKGSGNANPLMRVFGQREEEKQAVLKATVASAESKFQESLAEIDAAQANWEQSTDASLPKSKSIWEVPKVVAAKGIYSALKRLKDGSIRAEKKNADNDTQTLVLQSKLSKITAIQIETIRDGSLPGGGPGRAPNGNFVLTDITGDATPRTGSSQPQQLSFSSAVADYSQMHHSVDNAIDDDLQSGWAVEGGPEASDRVAIFYLADPIEFEKGANLNLRLAFDSEHSQHTLGRYRISVTREDQPALPGVPLDIAKILAKAADQRSDKERKQLTEYYRNVVSNHPAQTALNVARKQLSDFENSIPTTMVMQDQPEPREAFVLDKGIYTKPGEKVEPGVIAALYPADKEMPKDRLEFARWLVDPSNPLTTRVTVNRYWQTFFGTGIVKTTENFGVQSEAPSHPELLDWLAVHFMKSGWDVKAMHRLMVTSAAYRQSSRTTPELQEIDPANRMLARGPRHRLLSYIIRDQALAVSGLLVERVGGPPVKPYMADGVWEDASIGRIGYKRDHGSGLYRRSVYTFWRRIAAPAMFFDISARSICMVRLPVTNTPLQALILMNDVQYVEASRQLATRVMREVSTPAERIGMAFRLCTSRLPNDDERKVLLDAYESMLQRYRSDAAAADKLTSQGDTPRSKDFDLAELASYTNVASLILNFDETISKE